MISDNFIVSLIDSGIIKPVNTCKMLKEYITIEATSIIKTKLLSKLPFSENIIVVIILVQPTTIMALATNETARVARYIGE